MSSVEFPSGPIEGPPPSGPEEFTPLAEEDVIQDVIAPAQPLLSLDELINGRITISAYSQATILPMEELKATLRNNETTSSLNNRKLTTNYVDQAIVMNELYQVLAKIVEEEENLKNLQQAQTDVFNQAANYYNSQVEATMPYYVGSESSDDYWTRQMNEAIDQYNLGLINDAQFNIVVTNYNNYVIQRNQTLEPLAEDYNDARETYNEQVEENNEKIEDLNEIRERFGIPSIPDQPEATVEAFSMPEQDYAPLSTPVPSIPARPFPPTMPPIGPVTATQDGLMNQFFLPAVSTALGLLNLFKQGEDIRASVEEFLRFFLREKSVNLPESAIERLPDFLFSTGGGQVGNVGGVALATISAGLGSPHLAGLIQNSILSSDQKIFQLEKIASIVPELEAFGLKILTNTGLQATLPALNLLGDGAFQKGSLPAFKVAFGIAFSEIITDLVKSGTIKEEVQKLVEKELAGKIPPEELGRVIEILTSQVNLGLLQFASFELAASLQSPGLAAQVFGNAGVPEEAFTAAANRGSTPGEVLQDPLKTAFLKSTLSATLTEKTGLELAKTQRIINEIINQAAIQSNISLEKLASIVENDLVKQGIDRKTAVETADLAVEIVKKDSVRSTLSPGIYKEGLAERLLTAALVEANVEASTAQRLSQEAILKALRFGAFSTDAQFQLFLQLKLEGLGIESSVAAKAAATAVAGLAVQPSPFEAGNVAGILTPVELSEQVLTRVQSLLRGYLTPEEARRIGVKAAGLTAAEVEVGDEITNPDSLTNLLRDAVAVLNKESDGKADTLIAESFRFFMGDAIDLFVTHKKIIDPAYSLVLSMHTGIMYAGQPEPSNFRKSIDIAI
jgi:hypothetical protein